MFTQPTRRRVRQHVNPLSAKYQQPIPLPDWHQVYAHPTQPLHLDIGCGRGEFLLQMAQQDPTWNFLGLEIRKAIVEQAQTAQAELNLSNIQFLFCNVNLILPRLLASLPSGCLQQVSIQFPDPWFKHRHQKRRVVQPDVVECLANYLIPGGLVFLQSDVESVFKAMVKCFAAHPAFIRQGSDSWQLDNPFPAQTEREQLTLAQEKPIYRALFQRREGDSESNLLAN